MTKGTRAKLHTHEEHLKLKISLQKNKTDIHHDANNDIESSKKHTLSADFLKEDEHI